tara:strand:+ start:2915 stop:3127 length:213 start_codon:yes stop_codon:yes gene_type:complete
MIKHNEDSEYKEMYQEIINLNTKVYEQEQEIQTLLQKIQDERDKYVKYLISINTNIDYLKSDLKDQVKQL